MRNNKENLSTYAWTSIDGTEHIIIPGADGVTEADLLALRDLDRLDENAGRRYRRHHPSLEVFMADPDKCELLEDPDTDVERDVVEKLDRALMRNALRAAMKTLSPEQARLLSQVYVEEIHLREIARREGVHDNAIRKRLRIILKKIKENF